MNSLHRNKLYRPEQSRASVRKVPVMQSPLLLQQATELLGELLYLSMDMDEDKYLVRTPCLTALRQCWHLARTCWCPISACTAAGATAPTAVNPSHLHIFFTDVSWRATKVWIIIMYTLFVGQSNLGGLGEPACISNAKSNRPRSMQRMASQRGECFSWPTLAGRGTHPSSPPVT